LRGSTADDVAKETAIFRAHKATPIVIADEGEVRYSVGRHHHRPPVDPALGFVLSAMVGHLFGYEAALAIDASARPLREAREAIEHRSPSTLAGRRVLVAIRAGSPPLTSQRFLDGLRDRLYDGHLEASTAVRLVGLLRDLQSHPVEAVPAVVGQGRHAGALIDELVAALTEGDRGAHPPVDAIKHQAKTVTVGISRSDEGVVDRARAGHAPRRCRARRAQLPHAQGPRRPRPRRSIEVTGYTRYASTATRSRSSTAAASRATSEPRRRRRPLVGTKHRVADAREVLVARGRRDGAP
jgi:glutamine---fructose-6-phosphate transaminase (isomerizing)